MNKLSFIVLFTGSCLLAACNCGQTTPANSSGRSSMTSTTVATVAADSTNSASYYQQLCNSAGGYFQYGTVNAPPNSDYSVVTYFKAATQSQYLQNIPLSHTHIEITSALDGNVYDVALDNVFAINYNGVAYDVNSGIVPPAYSNNIQAGETLYFCSGDPSHVPYTASGDSVAQYGFDWVHTNCSDSGYTSNYQDGWLYDSNGNNLTFNQTYCYLWGNT